MKNLWIIIWMLFLSPVVWGQYYSTVSKKAMKNFEEARACYQQRDDACVEEKLKKVIQADPEFLEAYQLLAQLLYDRGRLEEAIDYYSTSLEIDSTGNPEGYRLLAGMTLQTGDYERSLALINTYLAFSPGKVSARHAALILKEKCLFAMEALKHPVPFQPENLGDSVNSEFSEYWPYLSVDNRLLMFTVLVPVDSQAAPHPSGMQEDFYYSTRSGSHWTMRRSAGYPLNTPDNEGAHTMTADGRTLYFTACNRRDGQGRCDIYVSTREQGRWSKPVNLGAPVNTIYSEKHPAVSADGRRLYFSSDRPGGKGSYDIWMSVRSGDGWGKPENLGDSVNTSGTEQSPFIHFDQQTLYFSSTGWPGMGRSDLFISRINSRQSWGKAKNLGYPINTFHDEIGLTLNARGNTAYFASDRGGGRDTDLFSFEMPGEVRPMPVSYMTGRVYDSRTMKGVGAVVQLIDLGSGETVTELETSEKKGDYLVTLPTGRDYAFNVTAGGYLFHSDHFTFSGIHDLTAPLRRDIPLDRVAAGSAVVLHNVFFETDAYLLKPESRIELNKVVEFLQNNPDIEVEISGHTDNRGTPEYNQNLSEQRARAVVEYLVQMGIAQERLKYTGYGERKPVDDNSTAAGRAGNRRTELKITGIRQKN